MQLYDFNSVEDLICRGYKSSEILNLKNVDTGYNNNKYNTVLKNTNRLDYKYKHLQERFTIDELKTHLDKYNNGITKKELLELLLIHDYEKFNLKKAFDYLNLSEEFKLADKNNKLNYLKKGAINKYGVDNVFKLKEFQDKAAKTREKRYGGKYTLSKGSSLEPSARQNSIETNKSDEVKEKRIQTNIKKYGVPHTSQSLIIQQKARKTRKKNNTYSTSKSEQQLNEELLKLFNNVQTQFNSTEYPFACDFYIPERQLYIELNATWTHGSAWYNINNPTHKEISKKWKKSSGYYKSAYKTWTNLDVRKRKIAKENNLNYLVFWQPDLSDFYLWVQLGCPDAKDWINEYSWLNYRKLPEKSESNNLIPLKDGSKSIIKIARQFMYHVIYEREIKMWNENQFTNKKGYVQPLLFANRLKYIHKTPEQLTDLEIIRGLSYSGQIRSYTAFDNTLMKQFIEKYKPTSIFDPCAGWGERLLTAACYNITYHGQDINQKLEEPYQNLIDNYNLTEQSITIIDSSTTKNKADCLFTCPPYLNTEIYTENGAENLNDDDFIKWWDTIIKNSDVNTIAFQINQKYKTVLTDIVIKNGYKLVEELKLNKQASHFNKSKKEFESLIILQKA